MPSCSDGPWGVSVHHRAPDPDQRTANYAHSQLDSCFFFFLSTVNQKLLCPHSPCLSASLGSRWDISEIETVKILYDRTIDQLFLTLLTATQYLAMSLVWRPLSTRISLVKSFQAYFAYTSHLALMTHSNWRS